MDGTLLDSSKQIANTINHVRISTGLEKLDDNLILQKVNDPSISPSKFFYNSDEFLDIHTELFEEYYHKNCINDIELYDGVKDLLVDLKDDFILAIATNARKKQAYKMLEHTGIKDFFTLIVCSDMVANPKPEPDMLLKILDDLKIDIKNSILIGDGYKDSLSAQKVSMDYLLVDWGFSDLDDVQSIGNIDELKHVILGWFNMK
jgi:phosphoglycolate phosphatase